MDSFAENVLERARLRSKMLQGIGGSFQKSAAPSATGNISTSPKLTLKSHTKLSTVIPGSPKGQMQLKHNVLNFQQEHFDMEIKLASMDKCLVQVEIQEQVSDDDCPEVADLREESKYRLHRLGKLYSEKPDDEMSSPIHNRTEVKVAESVLSATERSNITQKGRSKLAALAQNIHQWQNESPLPLPSSAKSPNKSVTTPIKIKPQESTSDGNMQFCTSLINQHQPLSSIIHNKNEQQNSFDLNDSILNALESQGYSREDLNAKKKLLTYKFSKQNDNVAKGRNNEGIAENSKVIVCKSRVPANCLIEDEKRTPRGRPSIHSNNQPTKDNKDPSALSLHERKAIFERNAEKTPLLPKTAFTLTSSSAISKSIKHTTKQTNSDEKMENDQNLWNITGNGKDKILKLDGQGIVTNRLNAMMNIRENNVTISQQQIQAKIKEEKERDMDLLLNRFPKSQENKKNAKIMNEDDQEVELEKIVSKTQKRSQGSEENKKLHNTSRTSVLDLSGCSAQVQSVLGDVQEVRVRHISHNDHTRLYPVLSDIETATETETDVEEAGYNNEVVADTNMMEESSESDGVESSVSSSTADVDTSADMREDEDDCGGPTPPKYGKVHFKSPIKDIAKSPIKYQLNSPRNGDELFTPTHVLDGDTIIPLQHTVSFYRKQQQNSAVKNDHRIIRPPPILDHKQQQIALDSIFDDKLAGGTNNSTADDVDRHISQLRLDVQAQERTIAQASRALTLCNARLEFNGSTEQVEAERLLLLATHRRQAALYEIGRVQMQELSAPIESTIAVLRGDLVVGRVTLPLKREYVRALGAAGGSGHHVVCLFKCDDAAQQVLASRLVSTAATSVTNTIDCVVEIDQPTTITLQSIHMHSTVTIEVYCLQAHDQNLPHHIKYHIKQTTGGGGSQASGGLTPRKLLLPGLLRGKDTVNCESNRMIRVPAESPGGPNTARSSSFALMGYSIFIVRSLLESNNSNGNGIKKQFILSATPQMSPLEGCVEVSGVRCKWEIPPVERRGFLTMYEDVTGFGAWYRRWFKLDGANLKLFYWKYPDDEAVKDGRIIDLSGFQPNVGIVPREVCARLHTLLLQYKDADTGKFLLSADTKEERIAWCNDLNQVLGATTATKST